MSTTAASTKQKRCYACKRTPWTCRGCGAKCCEHLCSLKLDDGSASCGKCKQANLRLHKGQA